MKKATHAPHPNSPDARLADGVIKSNLARTLKANQLLREHARELIEPGKLIQEILDIKLRLEPVRDPQTGRLTTLDSHIQSALKSQVDIAFKLLDKALPNLKATEITAHHQHDHNHVHAEISDIELAQRLQLWRKQHPELANPAQSRQPDNVIDITPAVTTREETRPADPADPYDFI